MQGWWYFWPAQVEFQHTGLQSVLAVLPAVLYTRWDSITLRFRFHFGSCPTGRLQKAAVTPEIWDRGSFWGYIPHYCRKPLETWCISTELTIKTRGVQNDALPALTSPYRSRKQTGKLILFFYSDHFMDIWINCCTIICIWSVIVE